MKLKYIALSLASIALLPLSSCGDFLEKVPDTRVELETVEQLRELLNNGYTRYNYSTPCELSTDNVIDNNAPDPDGVRFNLASYAATDDQAFKFEDVTMGMDNDSPSGIWEGCYHAIACANAALGGCETLTSLDEMAETLLRVGIKLKTMGLNDMGVCYYDMQCTNKANCACTCGH